MNEYDHPIYDGSHERTITPEHAAELQSIWDTDEELFVERSGVVVALVLVFAALLAVLIGVQLWRWIS